MLKRLALINNQRCWRTMFFVSIYLLHILHFQNLLVSNSDKSIKWYSTYFTDNCKKSPRPPANDFYQQVVKFQHNLERFFVAEPIFCVKQTTGEHVVKRDVSSFFFSQSETILSGLSDKAFSRYLYIQVFLI